MSSNPDVVSSGDVRMQPLQLESKKPVLRVAGKRPSTLSSKIRKQEILATKGNICEVFGLKGFLLLVITLVIGTSHVLIFTLTPRKGYLTYVSLAAATLFLLLDLFFLFGWRIMSDKWVQFQLEQPNPTSDKNRIPICVQTLLTLWEDIFDINGKYYLLKMTAMELAEDYNQAYILKRLHMCSLPVEWTSLFCIALFLEAFHRSIVYSKFLYRGSGFLTVHDRDGLVMADLLNDVFFLITPIAVYRFWQELPLHPEDVFFVTFVPTVTSFLKLRELLVDIVHINAEEIVEQSRTAISKKANRQRQSLFREASFNIEVARMQNRYFSRSAKFVTFVLSAFFAAAALTVPIVQLVFAGGMASICRAKHGMVIWDSCTAPVYFCQNAFVATCDCAVLEINKHNMTKLPSSFVSLTAMRRLVILNGPLESVPKDVSSFQSMSILKVDYSRLSSFDVDVSKMPKLVWLSLMYGRLLTVHQSVWKHKTLGFLALNSNHGLRFPRDAYMPSLGFLNFQNNSVLIPSSFGIEQFPILIKIYLSGNHFEDVEKAFEGFTNMQHTSFARCNVSVVPNAFKDMNNLVHFDVRDNNITFIGPALTTILTSPKVYALFADNPICHVDTSLHCKPLCSKYCFSEQHFGDGICGYSCNSKACKFDGGDCLVDT